MCVRESAFKSRCLLRPEVLNSCELEAYGVVTNPLIKVLEIKLGSLVRAVLALHHGAVSAVPLSLEASLLPVGFMRKLEH